MKKLTFYSSGRVANLFELNLMIIDVGHYCYDDNNFFQNEFKKTKKYFNSIENYILELILKECFEDINLIFYNGTSLYFKKDFIHDELQRRNKAIQ